MRCVFPFYLRFLATCAAFAASAGQGRGAEESAAETSGFLPWEKGAIRAGGFIAGFASDLTFGINSTGIAINAEDTFGLDTNLTVFRGDIMYRPSENLKHQLDFTYAAYHRSGSKALDRQIEVDGSTYPIGTYVETVFNFDIIRLTYSYAVIQDERMRIAFGLGTYAMPLKYGISATTIGPGGTRTAVEGADTILPLPAAAFRAEFQLIPKLFLNTSIDTMYLEYEDFKGSLLDLNFGLEYQLNRRFGVGLGYNAMSVRVLCEKNGSDYPGANFIGTVDVNYTGLLLYAKWSL